MDGNVYESAHPQAIVETMEQLELGEYIAPPRHIFINERPESDEYAEVVFQFCYPDFNLYIMQLRIGFFSAFVASRDENVVPRTWPLPDDPRGEFIVGESPAAAIMSLWPGEDMESMPVMLDDDGNVHPVEWN